VVEVTQMMGVSPEVFSTWKAEYAELFGQLISRFPEPEQLSTVTKTVGSRRIAYISGCLGGRRSRERVAGMQAPVFSYRKCGGHRW
jgi:hypothetical protein